MLARFSTILLILPLAALLGLGTLAGLISLEGARQGLVNPAAMSASLILQKPARLIIANQRGPADEPLPLGISLDDASNGETRQRGGLEAWPCRRRCPFFRQSTKSR